MNHEMYPKRDMKTLTLKIKWIRLKSPINRHRFKVPFANISMQSMMANAGECKSALLIVFRQFLTFWTDSGQTH